MRIDEEPRARIRMTAEQLGVADRTALRHVTDHIADELAKQYVLIVRALVERYAFEEPVGRRRGHRLVR